MFRASGISSARLLLLRATTTVAALTLAATASVAQTHLPTDWAGSRRPLDANSPAGIAYEAAMNHALGISASNPAEILSGAGGVWQRVAPPRGQRQVEAAMVFDPVRSRMLVFGGLGDDGEYGNEVFSLAIPSGSWTPLATSGTPPPGRFGARAVYDPTGDRLIVFGGWNGTLLGDVWQLTLGGTPTWSEITPGGGPGPRLYAGSLYDVANDRMVVFGGFREAGAYYWARSGDVWALSLSGAPDWTLLADESTGPGERYGASAAYDPAGPAMIVFGGYGDGLKNDLWRFELDGSNEWSELADQSAPPGRALHVGEIHASTRRLIVTGGYGPESVHGDVWTLDLAQLNLVWTARSPMPRIFPRYGAASAVRSNGDLYVQGGYAPNEIALGEVWWTSIGNPTSWNSFVLNLPPRLQSAMILDTNRDRLVNFGGTDGSYRNDTYTHSMEYGLGWEPLTTLGPVPRARRLHSGIFDPIGDRMIVFGGYDDQLLGDLWELSFSGNPKWTLLQPSGGGPSPRGGHVAIYDAQDRRMIVYGGYDGVTPPGNRISDVWSLALDGPLAWTQLLPGAGPSARSSASAVYDADHHAMILFGGTTPTFLNESWRLSLDSPPSWTLLASGAGSPTEREEQAAAYDTKRDRMLIFGGYDTNIQNLGDLASQDLDAAGWSVPSATGIPPSPRWGAKALSDAGRDGMWLYGGWNYGYLNDLWFLQWFDDPGTTTMATVTSSAEADRAVLTWQVPPGTVVPARVERSSDGNTWLPVGFAIPAADGTLRFDDPDVSEGSTYAWRASLQGAGLALVSDPAWLSFPGTTGVVPAVGVLALTSAGLASGSGSVAISCALPGAGSARLELLDVAGRRLDEIRWYAGGAGTQRLELGRGLPSGVYFARLSFGGRVVQTRLPHLR